MGKKKNHLIGDTGEVIVGGMSAVRLADFGFHVFEKGVRVCVNVLLTPRNTCSCGDA